MKITISRSDFEKIRRHAEAELPDEACGLIAGYDTDDGLRVISKVYLLTNIDHTNEHFSIDPAEHLAAVKDMRANKLTPLGNWHSHPETKLGPLSSRSAASSASRCACTTSKTRIFSVRQHGTPSAWTKREPTTAVRNSRC